MSDRRPFVVRWRDAVLSEAGPPEGSTRLVLVGLSMFMDSRGGSCWPSIESLAATTALSDASVRRHLKAAKKLGWIRIDREQGEGRGWRQNHYTALLPDVRSPLAEVAEEDSGRAPLTTTGADAGAPLTTTGAPATSAHADDDVRSPRSGRALTESPTSAHSERLPSHEPDGEQAKEPASGVAGALRFFFEGVGHSPPPTPELEREAERLAADFADLDHLPQRIEAQHVKPGEQVRDPVALLRYRLDQERRHRAAAENGDSSPAAPERKNSADVGVPAMRPLARVCECGNGLMRWEPDGGPCITCRGSQAGSGAT